MLIKDGKIFTMSGAVFEQGSILIAKGKIKAIGQNLPAPKNAKIIEAKGMWVFPGFIEAHSHIGLHEANMGFEGSDFNETTDPITPHLRVIDGINPRDPAFTKALAAGVTTSLIAPGSANIVGGQCAVVKNRGTSIDEMVMREPAAMKLAFGENPKRVYKERGETPSTRMGTAALLREALIKARDYKVQKEQALAKGEPFTRKMKEEAWLQVLRGELPLKAHAHRADDILTSIRLAQEFKLPLILNHCTEGHLVADDIKESGFPAIVGPSMWAKRKVELSNQSLKTAAKLKAKGVKIAITTDHPVTPSQYLPLCAGLAHREGLSFEDALRAITIDAAEIIGVAARVGSIEVGKDADLAIFDGNPLETLTKTCYTIVDGQIVFGR